MKFCRIGNLVFKGEEYSFNPLLGILVEEPLSKTSKGIAAVDNPYLLEKRTLEPPYKAPEISSWVRFYAKALTFLSKHSFALAFLLGKCAIPVYKDAFEATLVYRKLYPGVQQKKLCLPRMLFAASLSKRFKKNGVAFVGAFLPSVQMHAWVIEDNMIADPFDNQWICYKPVLIIK